MSDKTAVAQFMSSQTICQTMIVQLNGVDKIKSDQGWFTPGNLDLRA